MMKVVIEIPEDDYKVFVRQHCNDSTPICRLYKAIKNGTVLPKEHGRLIDADRLETHFVGTEQGTDLEVYLEPTIIDAPTIIPADKGE